MDIMRQSACLVLYSLSLSRFIALFPLKLHDGESALRRNDGPDVKLHPWDGIQCLALAGPTMAQLEVCLSFDYL